jgi:hypothetical protein
VLARLGCGSRGCARRAASPVSSAARWTARASGRITSSSRPARSASDCEAVMSALTAAESMNAQSHRSTSTFIVFAGAREGVGELRLDGQIMLSEQRHDRQAGRMELENAAPRAGLWARSCTRSPCSPGGHAVPLHLALWPERVAQNWRRSGCQGGTTRAVLPLPSVAAGGSTASRGIGALPEDDSVAAPARRYCWHLRPAFHPSEIG